MLKTPMIMGISMVSQKNRRWLVAFTYAILSFLLAIFILIRPLESPFYPAGILVAVVVSRLIFGKLVKERALSQTRIGQMTSLSLLPGKRNRDHLDEREVILSNWAHYEAFRVLAYYSIFIGIVVTFLPGYLNPPAVLGAFEGISMALLILAFTLPQAILLWAEPDVPEEIRV